MVICILLHKAFATMGTTVNFLRVEPFSLLIFSFVLFNSVHFCNTVELPHIISCFNGQRVKWLRHEIDCLALTRPEFKNAAGYVYITRMDS
jgi:hypothetical protein